MQGVRYAFKGLQFKMVPAIIVQPVASSGSGVLLRCCSMADGSRAVTMDDMQGVMTGEGRTLMTKVTYYVFFPALVVTSLGTSVTAATLKSWWPVPVSTLLNVVLGMLLGAAVFPFVGMEPHLRPHFISCAGVGNLGNLMIVLVPSIAAKSSAFSEEDGEQGLAYVFTGLFAMCAPCPYCLSAAVAQ